MVTDLPTKFVTVTLNGRTKKVEDYVAAPDSLAEFEREIDVAAGTKRWVFLDEDGLEELARSGWLASSEEGAALLKQAIERDDVAIARRLIELGSDLDGPRDNRLPPLMSARSSSMVDLLVKAGANPNDRPIGRVAARTPLMSTSYKDAPVAEAPERALRTWTMDALRSGMQPVRATGASSPPCSAQEQTRRDRQLCRPLTAPVRRQSEVGRRRTVLDRGRPTVADFDQVLALLESAEKRIKR
jgi:hypothetical protein